MSIGSSFGKSKAFFEIQRRKRSKLISVVVGLFVLEDITTVNALRIRVWIHNTLFGILRYDSLFSTQRGG
jgi:hypothetical protein